MPFLPPNQQRQSTEGNVVPTSIQFKFHLHHSTIWVNFESTSKFTVT